MLISHTRNSQCPPFLLNGTQIEKVSHFKYLGILPHVVQTHRKKCLLQGTETFRIYVSHFLLYYSPESILHSYKTQVLPTLEYGCATWDPHLKQDKILIENVQCFAIRIATKSCTSQSSSFPYKLPSLNHNDSIINYFIPLNPTKCLVQPLAKTVSYFNSVFVSSTKLWDFLPKETVLIYSITFF